MANKQTNKQRKSSKLRSGLILLAILIDDTLSNLFPNTYNIDIEGIEESAKGKSSVTYASTEWSGLSKNGY